MNVFVSYGMHDLGLVQNLARVIGKYAKVFYWSKDKEPGKDVWPTIFGWIQQSSVVIPVITGRTVARAMAVAQEVGHARALGKAIIPLVEKTVPSSELGFLTGVTYVPVDPNEPAPALQAIEQVIAKLKSKDDVVGLAIVIGLAVAAIWGLSKG